MIGKIEEDLFRFAYCRRKNFEFNDYINELAGKVSEEDWGTNNRILKNYINFTFSKLASDYNKAEDSKKNFFISFIEGKCCFNTGLFNDFYEPIYAYFKENEYKQSDDDQSPWFLVGFKTPSDFELNSFDTLPLRAQFFEDAADLVYDYRLEIRANVRHILGDAENINRLPDVYKGMERTTLVQIFEGAIKTAEKRVAANYKLAVPQFYRNSLQLLIPLTLMKDSQADLALVLKKEGNIYTTRTCLTLDMAYNNARLIVKPESEWLKAEENDQTILN
ncbi:DUF3825 domain-containing protein [Enterococcus wangshanyuanii]|uniref:DUF3825 domain-containing protein n=1 Tax=Enterococcus wangshanyuanii TaxID=2005703 RepID=A0ABQ1P891_9ENTE|nr:DUF3825 domain-containing protein [Enterococcus wangshanyuanii]GGC92835.1 hypothetical protein GCM10011573_23050 [Enterococcus wangshanyuanii]